MIHILNHAEINQALSDFMEAQGINLKGKEADVTLTVGRSGNGHTASIEIVPETVDVVKPTKAKRATPKEAVEEKPVEVVEDSTPEVEELLPAETPAPAEKATSDTSIFN